MGDEDVTRKSGIYPYVLQKKEKLLSIRSVSPNMKREAYTRQGGKCLFCEESFQLDGMQGDHRILWSEGGKTISENCQMLCIQCHRDKSDKK